MTTKANQHHSCLVRALGTIARCFRALKVANNSKANYTPPEPKRRSHRTTAFFEIP